MAKRRRLAPAPEALGDELIRRTPLGLAPPIQRAPVADVAAEAAQQAAIDQLSDELTIARKEGRMVVKLPLAAIKADYLMRDRIHYDDEDMQKLRASLIARGQQTPIEVIDLGQGHYGLISGARRLMAMKNLFDETKIESFSLIQCLVRTPETAEDAYLAMVEENEVRANISFYERGRLVSEAVQLGIFETVKKAVKGLFAAATPARRSKILAFVVLHEALGDRLLYPEQIPEKLGLALIKRINNEPAAVGHLRKALEAAPERTIAQERHILEASLLRGSTKSTPSGYEAAKGVQLIKKKGQIVLKGPGVDDALIADISEFLAQR